MQGYLHSITKKSHTTVEIQYLQAHRFHTFNLDLHLKAVGEQLGINFSLYMQWAVVPIDFLL